MWSFFKNIGVPFQALFTPSCGTYYLIAPMLVWCPNSKISNLACQDGRRQRWCWILTFKITTNASLQDDQQVSNYHSRLEGDDDEKLEDDVEIPNGSSTNKM